MHFINKLTFLIFFFYRKYFSWAFQNHPSCQASSFPGQYAQVSKVGRCARTVWRSYESITDRVSNEIIKQIYTWNDHYFMWLEMEFILVNNYDKQKWLTRNYENLHACGYQNLVNIISIIPARATCLVDCNYPTGWKKIKPGFSKDFWLNLPMLCRMSYNWTKSWWTKFTQKPYILWYLVCWLEELNRKYRS